MIKLTKKSPEQYRGDMVVFFVRQADEGTPVCQDGNVQMMVDRAFSVGDFLGKEGQTFLYYPESSATGKNTVKMLTDC